MDRAGGREGDALRCRRAGERVGEQHLLGDLRRGGGRPNGRRAAAAADEPDSAERSAAAVEWLRMFATATSRACRDAEAYSDDIDEITPSPISQMPAELLDKCSIEEIRDLIAYIMSGGNPEDKRFK